MRIPRIFRSRKGQEEAAIIPSKLVLYMVLAVIIPLMALALVLITTHYRAQVNSYLDDVEDTVLEARFLSSPDCFARVDSVTGRVYPGVIDQSKFTQKRMDYCYDVPKDFERACFSIDLRDMEKEKVIGSVSSENWEQCSKKSIEREGHYVVLEDGTPAVMYISSLDMK